MLRGSLPGDRREFGWHVLRESFLRVRGVELSLALRPVLQSAKYSALPDATRFRPSLRTPANAGCWRFPWQPGWPTARLSLPPQTAEAVARYRPGGGPGRRWKRRRRFRDNAVR